MADLIIDFLGDISLNNAYVNLAVRKESPFTQVNDVLKNCDYLVGNLEAVVKSDEGENYSKQTRLSIHLESLKLLGRIKPDLLTLANNHIYDQLKDGFDKTMTYLDQNNIEYIGASSKPEKEMRAFIKQINGFKVAFLNYVHPETNPSFPDDIKISVNQYVKQNIITDISSIRKKVDRIVLILHWGMDNSRFPEPSQRRDAKEFAEAGADLIVGHHSHVLQGFEKIGSSYVFYSLGNFAFAPLKEGKEYGLDKNRQANSIILHWTIRDGSHKVSWTPIILDNLRVKPVEKTNIHKISRLIPLVSNLLVWPVYKFYLKYIYKLYFYFFGNGRNPIKRLKQIDRSKLNKAKMILKS
ncbi:MAG: CapA family protein [Bacteroidota bacterium]